MDNRNKTAAVLRTVIILFAGLAVVFLLDLSGQPARSARIPLVDTNFLSTATARSSYADLVRAGEDLSDFDCYGCHEKGKPPPLRFDTNQNLIIPKEHSNIVMGHGRHNRNNNCFNCHDEANLERFQTRDGRELKFADSTELCGSCHGPTYRDWEAGVHGRTSGFWNLQVGEHTRVGCASCHNPHSPKFPGRAPAPGPHRLHESVEPSSAERAG